mmetsp:Transcript_46829/g.83984  ORF Transcript_46829/g.83984 Transcript_46829/m.83984 type:complete len:81 (+) Transcript_46829:339-581(+)
MGRTNLRGVVLKYKGATNMTIPPPSFKLKKMAVSIQGLEDYTLPTLKCAPADTNADISRTIDIETHAHVNAHSGTHTHTY